MILDEASYCWPVRTVRPMRCFYGPVFKIRYLCFVTTANRVATHLENLENLE